MSNQRDLAVAILQEAAREQERQAELERRLRDPVYFHEKLLHLSLEDKRNGQAWLDLDPNSGYSTMRRFVREPFNGKGKMVLASRGCGKSYSVALPYVVERVLKDRSITMLFGGEKADEVRKRSLWMRTRMEEMDEDYGPLVDRERWAIDNWTIVRPGGRGGQDTLTVGSPDNPGTSQHWQLGIFDDPVGEWTARSAARGRQGIAWWRELQNQALEGSEIIIFDTLWPGENIITWIIKHLEGGLSQEPYGRGLLHRGRHFDILIIRDRDDDGNPIFPCQSDKYLELKEEVVGPEMFRSQYGQYMLGLEDLTFDGAPLLENEDRPDNLRIYIMQDTATSTGRARHTSISAIFVVGKDSNNNAWMIDGAAGKLGWDKVPDKIVDFWLQYHPERIPYEDTGPAKTLPASCEKAAFARGLNGKAIRKLFFPIPRTSDKHARIQGSRGYIMGDGERSHLHFCKTFPPSIFRIDHKRNQFRGTLGDEFHTYTFGADQSFDCLDAIADIWGYWGAGYEIFPAPKGKKPDGKKELKTQADHWKYIQDYYDKRPADRNDSAG